MKYLLDTNTCIRYMNEESEAIRDKLKTIPIVDIAVCSIVKAELFFGAMNSSRPEQNIANQKLFLDQFESLPFDDSCALNYGRVRAELKKLGTPIGPNDLMIAAIALSNDLVLVTHNVAEFSRVQGLNIEDWELLG